MCIRDSGEPGEGGRLELALLPQGDDGVGAGDFHAQGGPRPVQARDDDGRVPALVLGLLGAGQAGRPHVHGPQLAQAGDGAGPAACADGDGLAVGDGAQPLTVQDVGEQADGVATHLGHGSVSAVVVHEPLGLGHGGGEGSAAGQGGGPYDAHEAVGADTAVAVADRRDVGAADGDLAAGVDQHEEVVEGRVALDELTTTETCRVRHGP